MTMIALAVKTRRELCMECEHAHKFPLAGEDDVAFLCKLKYRSSCTAKAALRDKSATCPRADGDWSIMWSLAGLDTATGWCEGGDTDPPTPEQFAAMQAMQARRDAMGPLEPPSQRGINKGFKVYQ